ncbi:hypothetical protein FQN57_001727 [Myotisia sp. PD_48]|nr:hypothetical protein FQN57_001727 [Myotisia sp. PD_48]
MAKLKSHPELVFQKKNKGILKLPKNARIEKRPISHPPVASPYAGAGVQKVVYVSTKSPFMSVAKRVQKLLREAEKRAMQKSNFKGTKTLNKESLLQLKEVSEKVQKEPVYIRATGRAIDKAMNVGKWFGEMDGYKIMVNTGSVLAVDDIIGPEEEEQDKSQPGREQAAGKNEEPNPAPKKKRRGARPENGCVELPESRTRWMEPEIYILRHMLKDTDFTGVYTMGAHKRGYSETWRGYSAWNASR